ncbi:hypothetical protein QBC33DRAFT_603626 [Phialemonium atrogriseum]|uniref:Alcohol dehydrogenase-like N-terminal domain-containing protein n=1 Tax=Phialemonium atrogriseum TaxID=1093897 RepID=A0AAJ0BRP8_9PEZI|nr:uncharacterized protein QBC33DRAFT_603626 [Phialemonium atrogriseum]KAK1761899.1 hypothetical protein QBC33DRAFT_603626 [Phialemonium atrogriseum]
MIENQNIIIESAKGIGCLVHIHKEGFIAEFPLIPSHETVGVVAAISPKVVGFEVGNRVVADNAKLCSHCSYCRRGEALLCENVW